jgi:WD40 repeat protein
MSHQVGDHLPPEQVLAFGLGLLAPEQTAALESHVAECEACCRALLSVPDDALVSQLRDAVSTSGDSLACHATPTATSNGPAPEPTGGPPPLPPELTSHPRYRVEQLLGAGGTGAVYRAYHRVMERPVALKVISPGLMTRPAAVERFTREIKAAARLSHPNIVAALDAEQAGGTHFLVMEYVEGTDLARLVQQRGPLPAALACEYVRQAALGLQHAHERGLVHRDIKPSNLLLTAGGQVKVLDFGLALLASESAAGDLTSTGVVMGTADYIAPEQADDPHRADIRADVYSLGCTLYFLLTGRPPFPEGNFMQKVIAHSQRAPRPLTDFRNDLPPGLEQALGRMMAKGPAQRYQTPGEAARALARFATAEAIRGTATITEARPRGEADFATESVPAASRSSHRRRPRPLVAAALAVLLAGAGLLGLVVYRISTDRGEVVIETDDPDVEVVVRQGGKVVTVLDPRSKQKVTLDTGEYTVSLAGKPKGLKMDMPETFTLRRGDTKIVTVKRVSAEAPVGEVRRFEGHPGHIVWSVAVSPDGRHILSGGEDKLVILWDLAKGREVRRFEGHKGRVLTVAFSPDNRRAVSGGEDKVLRLWDVATGKELRRLEGHADWVFSVAFSPDGRHILSGGGGTWAGGGGPSGTDLALHLWEAETGKEVRRFEGHTDMLWSVTFSPDGKQALSASRDKTARLWDVATGKEVHSFDHPAQVGRAFFSPDGRRVLSECSDKVYLWDVKSAREIRRFEGHTGNVNWAVFSPDGLRVLSSSWDDHTLRLWDVDSGKEVHRFEIAPERPAPVAFTPDGRYAVSGGSPGAMRLWRLPDPPPPEKVGEARRPK